jgi:hypothetical protein
MRQIQSLFSLNRGVVDKQALARLDVKRVAMAAEMQTNWLPKALGPMILRPGRKYLGTTLSNAAARFLKFIFATTDTALLEMTDSAMRVWINDVLLTRPAVTTVINNPTFATGPLVNWTNLDEAGATSSYVAPNLQLVGSGTARAIREQQVSVAGANIGVEHGIRIVIARGPVTLRIGSTSGDDDYLRETTLYEGTHSISVVPTTDMFIRFFSLLARKTWVTSCTIEAAGVVSVPTPWTAADLSNVRIDQSADVVFAACANKQQRRIERRGTHPNARSWSVVKYAANDGPFRIQNITPTTIAASGLTGNITLTASVALFKPLHVGALFSLTSVGQTVSVAAAASATSTNSIRVTGVTVARTINITVAGDASGSLVTLERSFDNLTWGAVGGTNFWTANVATTYTDGLDNQIAYYRLTLTTRVAPDTVTMTLSYAAGSIRGIVRITDYTSFTSVGAEVLTSLGGTVATSVWQEGQWSDLRGWPTSGKIHEGRLWWFGQNGVWGSISDAFDAFDETVVGNGGAINRTIGSGPVDTIAWGLSLKGLAIGAQGAEFLVRASSLDEILTPTSFNVKTSSTQGSGNVDAVKIDQSGCFVNRSGVKVFDLSFDVRAYDFASTNMTELCPEIALAGIVRMDAQRLPDTRLHCVLADGTVAMAVMNKAEDILAWVPITASGLIEDVVTLPAANGTLDDQVYYVVRYTTSTGATVRYLEKWAQELDCRGDKAYCYLADAYVAYSGVATATITGLSHLEGRQVVVWADGQDVGTNDSAVPWTQRYTVAGGQITLATAASNVVVGLGYTAQFKSVKIGAITAEGSPLSQQKKVGHLGIVANYLHPKGVRFGADFDHLDDMPAMEDGTSVGTAVRTTYDENLIPFPGKWDTDLRVCIQGQAPRPATVLGITPDISANN